jgi:hypothetical protein
MFFTSTSGNGASLLALAEGAALDVGRGSGEAAEAEGAGALEAAIEAPLAVGDAVATAGDTALGAAAVAVCEPPSGPEHEASTATTAARARDSRGRARCIETGRSRAAPRASSLAATATCGP